MFTAMDLTDMFYPQSTTSGKVVLVEKYICTQCGRVYIRSAADAVTDNDLDLLRRCS